ncbi:CYFA0S01e15456g1_1 [Cyberlindnera fabianii]|uniref:CYFA0S01e15456g1_1 n=1 Tax=Cyberlindnera fabianii TaxID=36022 RepID=A0A061ASK1_CYBFA|nr:Sphingoid long chain base kinase 4 [Cyberlindnera fabianii]CDR37709.1 CYFA0S01e15456g1_1 [Cyberlindnera fabianii]
MPALEAPSTENLLPQDRSIRCTLSDTGIQVYLQDFRFSGSNPSSLTACLPLSTCGVGGINTLEESIPDIIPYEDILSVKPVDSTDSGTYASLVSVTYAQRYKHHLVPVTRVLNIDHQGVGDIITTIYERSYPDITPRKKIMAIVNPHGGKGKALSLFLEKAMPILDAAECEVTVVKTQGNKHAIQIAEEMDIGKYDVVACASGDGIPYEVFNGFYKRPDRARALNKIAVTQLPCGSGNAMSNSCHGTNEPSFAALSLVKSKVVNIDLMAVTQDGQTTVSFLSQTFGIIADADIGTEHLRFLGPVRFDIGVVQGILTKKRYPCEIAIKYAAKHKDELRSFYEQHSPAVADKNGTEITEKNLELRYDPRSTIPDDWEVLEQDFSDTISVFYTGKMPVISPNVNFFPASLPNDGAIDLIMMTAETPLTKKVPIMLSVDSGKHVDSSDVIHSKVLAYRLVPKLGKGFLSIDGENYPFHEYQVEVLPNAAKTLAKGGVYVETGF